MTSNSPPQIYRSIINQLAALSAEKRSLLEQKRKQKVVSVHYMVVQSLVSLGIIHVYGISGSPIIETMAACAATGVRVIGVRHQQAVVMMATAQNYASGRMAAVALISSDPAIKRALASGLPACINVRVDPDAPLIR